VFSGVNNVVNASLLLIPVQLDIIFLKRKILDAVIIV
jgi:hypothetical protein